MPATFLLKSKIIRMMHKVLIFLLFSIIFYSNIFAQEKPKDVTAPETPKEKKLEKKLVKKLYSVPQFAHESVLFVKQPTKWKGNNWLKAGGVVAIALIVMPFDEDIVNSTQGQQQYYYSIPVVAGRVYGEWYSIGGVFGLFGLYGIIFHDTAAKKISVELLQAGIYSELFTELLKVSIGRARPYESLGAYTFHPFTLLDDGFNSMPSGHTTAAVALSTVMSRHAHSTALKIIAYIPAGFTMFSRIYQDKHWLSDEVLGAAIGFFTGNWVVDLHEGKRHRINVTSIYPSTSLSVNLDWKSTKKIKQSEYFW